MKIAPIKTLNSANISFMANKMPKKQAEYMNSRFKDAGGADIFCHSSPDEDSFNSAKMLYEYFNSLGKNARIICDAPNKNFEYDEKKYNITSQDSLYQENKKGNIAICVDFSAPERIQGKAADYLSKFNKDDVFCFDHHADKTPISSNFIFTDKSYENAPDIKNPANFYIDASAKSASGVVARFFEALNINLTSSQAKSAYCGMLDDMNKNNLIAIDKGNIEIKDALLNDKNTMEVFNNISSKVSDKEKSEVLSHLDILSSLSSDEINFRENLYKNIKVTNNGKFAYAAIPPDDYLWVKAGGDNQRTSKILRDFRVRVLKHEKEDEFLDKEKIEKLKDVEAAAVFYPEYKSGTYRISLHSNKDYAQKLIQYNREHYFPNLTAGGHKNRAGGRIETLNRRNCAIWAKAFILSGENINYEE